MGKCKGFTNKGESCRYKGKGKYDWFCKKCYDKEARKGKNLCKDCGKEKEGDLNCCEECRRKRSERLRKKREKEKKCEYEGCKFKASEGGEFCKKHKKLGEKLKNPEMYCNKKGCGNLRKEGYVKCEKCYMRQRKKDENRKKKRLGIVEGKCKRCGKDIEEYRTKSGKKPELCKHHYELGVKAEEKRGVRDRDWSIELKNYKNKYPNKYNSKLIEKKIYNKSLKGKILDYKNRSFKNKKRELKISEKWMEILFKSECFYCGENPINNLNSIDRKDNNLPYTYENSVSCCYMCNYIKKTLNHKDFIKKCIHISNYNRSNKRIKLYENKFKNHNVISYNSYSKKCFERNWIFDINKKKFKSIISHDCYLCGKKNTKSHCNGIDRINNKLHYQLFNIISCCTDCNMMKRNYKYESFIEKCNQIKKYNNKKLNI